MVSKTPLSPLSASRRPASRLKQQNLIHFDCKLIRAFLIISKYFSSSLDKMDLCTFLIHPLSKNVLPIYLQNAASCLYGFGKLDKIENKSNLFCYCFVLTILRTDLILYFHLNLRSYQFIEVWDVFLFTQVCKKKWYFQILQSLQSILNSSKMKWTSRKKYTIKKNINSMDSTTRKSVVGSKRSSKFKRSDALSPNSANNILIENELGAAKKLITFFVHSYFFFAMSFFTYNACVQIEEFNFYE